MHADDRHEMHPDDLTSRDDLARGLTALRERSGLTVRDVARAADLPVATVGGWFSGRHLPPLATADQFARMLAVLGAPESSVAAWVAAVARLRRAPGRRPAGTPAPYRGLAAYEPGDANVFFGREQLTADLVALVESAPDGPVVVIGPSGSGKSSLLRAGLAAHLTATGRRVVVLTPGTDPLDALGDVSTRQQLRPGDVLVVDQLEELFTVAPSVAATTVVVESLAQAHRTGAMVVLGLRADFFDRALGVELLARWLSGHQVLVGPMSAQALRRVVVEPARVVGIEVDDALVEVLVAEATAGSGTASSVEPGVLPLLSHALYVTWLSSSGRRLTLAQYRAAGGLAGAIAQTAEEVYSGLTAEQRAVARRTILHLVHVRDDAPDTRRPANRDEFDAPDSREVVSACVDARLVTLDRGHVQLAHEALLSAWPRLRSWLEADRDGLRVQGRTAEAARHWMEAGKDPDLLYRGTALATASTWVTDTERAALAGATREFLDASQEAEGLRTAVRRRATRRLRVLASGLAVLAASTGGLATAAVVQNRAITAERDLAVSRQLAVTAQSLAGTDPGLASQVAAAAYLTGDTVEARSALLSASGRGPPRC